MPTEDFIEKQEKTGKRILQFVVITNLTLFVAILVTSLLDGIFHNIIGLIIMIIACLFIYNGGQISKWLYIVVNTINVLNLIFTLFAGTIISQASIFLNVITIMMLVVSIVTSVILIFSTSVKEFMYKQRF